MVVSVVIYCVVNNISFLLTLVPSFYMVNQVFIVLSGISPRADIAHCPKQEQQQPNEAESNTEIINPYSQESGKSWSSLGLKPLHRLVHNQGGRALTCLYCKLTGCKTDRGYSVRSYYRCEACDTALCSSGSRNCYELFHLFLRKTRPNLSWLKFHS